MLANTQRGSVTKSMDGANLNFALLYSIPGREGSSGCEEGNVRVGNPQYVAATQLQLLRVTVWDHYHLVLVYRRETP